MTYVLYSIRFLIFSCFSMLYIPAVCRKKSTIGRWVLYFLVTGLIFIASVT